MQAVARLRSMLKAVPPVLEAMPLEKVSSQSGPDEWSARQELGHLLDSAIMNHVRFVRTLMEENPTLVDYDGVRWVEAHDYHHRDWHELISTWSRLNAHFLMVAERTLPEMWKRT